MTKTKLAFFFLAVLVLGSVLASPALAQSNNASGKVAGPCSDADNLGACIVDIYRWSLGIGVLLALIVLIAAGYLYVTSSGNANQVSKAKEYFTGAIIGLIILFAAVLILQTINPELVNTNLNVPNVTPPRGGGGYYDPSVCNPVCNSNQVCKLDSTSLTMKCVDLSKERGNLLNCTPACTGGKVCTHNSITKLDECTTLSVQTCNPRDPNSCPAGEKCTITSIQTGGTAVCK